MARDTLGLEKFISVAMSMERTLPLRCCGIGWANQTLSIFTLWAITVYLVRTKGGHWHLITEIPALFMTVVCLTYIFTQKIGLGLPMWAGLGIAAIIALSLDFILYYKVRRK